MNAGMSSIDAPSGVSVEIVSLLSSASKEANTHSAESGGDAKAESSVSVGTGASDEIEDEAVAVTTRRRRGVWYGGWVQIIFNFLSGKDWTI